MISFLFGHFLSGNVEMYLTSFFSMALSLHGYFVVIKQHVKKLALETRTDSKKSIVTTQTSVPQKLDSNKNNNNNNKICLIWTERHQGIKKQFQFLAPLAHGTGKLQTRRTVSQNRIIIWVAFMHEIITIIIFALSMFF